MQDAGQERRGDFGGITAHAVAPRREGSRLAIALLLGANALPVLGVLSLGWDLFPIMFLYWAENGIVGLLSIPRILLAAGAAEDRPVGLGTKLFDVLFFTLHYGLFWAVHGVFVFALFAPSSPWGIPATTAICVLVLFASHGTSLLVNYVGHGEYLRTSPARQTSRPYARVVVLHATVLGGGLLTLLVGAPEAALLVLVVAKTLVDLRAHLREHRPAHSPA